MHLFERLSVSHIAISSFHNLSKDLYFILLVASHWYKRLKTNTSTALDLYVRQSKRAPSIHADKVSDSKKKEGKKIETETRDPMDLRFAWQRGIQVGNGIEAEIFFIIRFSMKQRDSVKSKLAKWFCCWVVGY